MQNNLEIENLKNEIKPFLRSYLESQGVKPNSKGQFHCFNPSAHTNGDKSASASITPNGLGYKCFACEQSGDIFTACNHFEGRSLDGKNFIETVKYLADKYNVAHELDKVQYKKNPTKKYIKETEYIYTDLNNQPIYKIIKMVNPENKKDKQFYPYMYDAIKGDYSDKSGFSEDCKRELYHLVEVNKMIESDGYIFFVEGEKCVEILRKLGLIATCIQGGAMAWKKPHSNRYVTSLCNAKVVILPDNDAAGRKFSNQVAKDIISTANIVKVLELEGLPPKGDIEQWFQLGGTKEKLLELCESTKGFTGEKEFDKIRNVYVQDRTYRRRGKEEDKTISNFIIIPYECVEENGVHYFFAEIITDSGKKFNVEFSSEVFINKTMFKKVFQNAYLSFTGNDEDLQTIKLIISDGDYNYKTGVKYIGIHKMQDKYIFVGNDKSLTRENVEDESTVLMPQYKLLETSILDNDIITQSEIKNIVSGLFRYNSLDKTATIMGFLSACFFKAHFMELKIDFPHLLIFGEAGSGKTQTVERVIKPFFSIAQSFSADQLTPFTSMKICSSSNVIPFIIEEYKPRKITDRIKNTISALLRNSYNNFSGVRGSADQSMKSYNLINPIVLLGEESIIEPAIQERSLELSFGKSDLTEEARTYFSIIQESQDVISKLGKSMLVNALKISPVSVMDIYRELEKIITKKENLQSRIINNICVIITGLTLLNKTLQRYESSIEDCTGYKLNTLVDAIVSSIQENILSSNGNSISTIDSTIEIFDTMAAHNILNKNIDYTFIVSKDGQEQLALDIKFIYDKFTKYIKDYNKQDETITNQAAFAKQLRKADYFVGYMHQRFKTVNENNQVSTIKKRAYILDLSKLNKKIELQKFVSEMYQPIEEDDEDNPFQSN